jgi:hypothetical protein
MGLKFNILTGKLDIAQSNQIGASEDLQNVVVYPTRADFPPTGRLARLYLDDDAGTLWRWTGTTYNKITAGDLDAGIY